MIHSIFIIFAKLKSLFSYFFVKIELCRTSMMCKRTVKYMRTATAFCFVLLCYVREEKRTVETILMKLFRTTNMSVVNYRQLCFRLAYLLLLSRNNYVNFNLHIISINQSISKNIKQKFAAKVYMSS